MKDFMPLVKRTLSRSQVRNILWLCSCPCTVPAALLLMVCCQYKESINCACALCIDENIDESVALVARYALVTGLLTESHLSLSALKTEQWDSTELLSFSVHSSNDLLGHIKQEVHLSVLKVFNEYNFGPIKSGDLTLGELEYIGKELGTEIFSRLPPKERFYSDASANEINPGDKNALNGYLAGLIMVIIGGDFIQEQLNRISWSIEDKRSGTALISSQAQASMFRGREVAQNSTGSDLPLVDTPPAHTRQAHV
jgi:hypothetical protein